MNRYRKYVSQVGKIVSLIGLCLSASASFAASEEYVPDTRVFDGSNTLRFSSNPILSLIHGGTIEFWVAAEWTEDPGYAPVALLNQGLRPIYEVSIAGDRTALQLLAADQFGRFEFDFSDGEMHHVAISDYLDSVYVMVDGDVIGAVSMSFAEAVGSEFWIGAGQQNQRVFIGSVAGVRIWEGAIELATLAEYAMRSVHSKTTPHPDLGALIGESDFRSENFNIANTLILDVDSATQQSNHELKQVGEES